MTPEVHDVVIWSHALDKADEILADLASRFRLLDVIRVEWSDDRFGACLSRFYEDSTMGTGSSKERHIGKGPFLVAIVEDPGPTYDDRVTSRGVATVHEGMFDAKARYRELTGGGHRVHGSVTVVEADRDLFFILGRRSSSFRERDVGWGGGIDVQRRDVIGVAGWDGRTQLFTDLELSLPYVLLAEEPVLTVLIEERWWADVVTATHDMRRSERLLTIPVAGEPLDLAVSHVGDGSLESDRQRSLIAGRVRNSSGVFVPGAPEEATEAVAALSRYGWETPTRWQRLRSTVRR